MSIIIPCFGASRPLIGVVHLLPLPGSPAARPMSAVLARAREDTRAWVEGGADGIVVENFGDVPFHAESVPAITVAALARVIGALLVDVRIPIGINVLRNDVTAALSLASAFGLGFVRANVHCGVTVTDQGVLTGRAADTLRLRASLPGDVAIYADVDVKHGRALVDRPLEEVARETRERGLADALLLTGTRTSAPADLKELRTLRTLLPDTPLLLASGVTPDRVQESSPDASGWIVGTYAKHGGDLSAPVDVSRVRELDRARRDS